MDVDETANLLYFIRLFLQNQEPILIVGPGACGKSKTLQHYLRQQSADKYIANVINLSGHADVNRIQSKVITKIDRYVVSMRYDCARKRIQRACGFFGLDDVKECTDRRWARKSF